MPQRRFFMSATDCRRQWTRHFGVGVTRAPIEGDGRLQQAAMPNQLMTLLHEGI
jgi:hypothetical protein